MSEWKDIKTFDYEKFRYDYVDLLVKRWNPNTDEFTYFRVPDCLYINGYWYSYPYNLKQQMLNDVFVVAWMDIPELPQCDDAKVYI